MKFKTIFGAALIASSPIAHANVLEFVDNLRPYDASIKLDVQTSRAQQNSGVSGATFLANGNYQFEAFCIEIEQHPWATNPYTRTIMSTADERYGNLSRLYANWYDIAKTSGLATAAFATAIWEIQYDSKGSLNFKAGEFRVNVGPQAVLDLANQMISSVQSSNTVFNQWQFTIWANPVDQDLLEGKVVATVPVPATLSILGLGLLALGLRSRTKATA
jgi:hypothetical protein